MPKPTTPTTSAEAKPLFTAEEIGSYMVDRLTPEQQAMSPDDLDLDLTTQALAKVNAAKKAKAA